MPKQKPTKSKKLKKQAKPEKRAKPSKAKPAKLAKQLKRAEKEQAKQVKRTEKKQAKKAKKAGVRLNGSSKRGNKTDGKADKARASLRQVTQLPMAAPNMRVGLLGGSFNPPHQAHLDISLAALKRLDLDRVWWLVTPGNPLKNGSKLPSLAERVQGARNFAAKHPGVEVTGFAGQKGSLYTIDVLTELKRRFPTVKFVWLMGADNLADFHRWRAWDRIFRLTPIAVLDRPTFRLKARASRAAHRFSESHVDESDAPGLAQLTPPAWTVLTHKLSPLSSTTLRAQKPSGKKAQGKGTKRAKKGKKH